jgi:hypothetical protein
VASVASPGTRAVPVEAVVAGVAARVRAACPKAA